jgi:hypothetical protein
MQAIIYGLTGGSETFEADKHLRWSHAYFRGRLAPSNTRAASVEVDFSFGDHDFSVRRSFAGNAVVGFRSGGRRSQWLEDREEAEAAFEGAVLRRGGYPSVSYFAFIVHRLLYLPESRRLLAWDTEAQLRILIILNQDLAPERTFDARRRSLQLLDSKKRHARVAINKADKELATLMEFEESAVDDDETADQISRITDEGTAALAAAMRDLQTTATDRARAEREAESVSALLSTTSTEIETLQERIDREESSLILHLVRTRTR